MAGAMNRICKGWGSGYCRPLVELGLSRLDHKGNTMVDVFLVLKRILNIKYYYFVRFSGFRSVALNIFIILLIRLTLRDGITGRKKNNKSV
jgi:hypothetical protein